MELVVYEVNVDESSGCGHEHRKQKKHVIVLLYFIGCGHVIYFLLDFNGCGSECCGYEIGIFLHLPCNGMPPVMELMVVVSFFFLHLPCNGSYSSQC